jgi:hypothetical protein
MLYSKRTAWNPYQQHQRAFFGHTSKKFKMDGMVIGLPPVPPSGKKERELTDEERILIAAILRILR